MKIARVMAASAVIASAMTATSLAQEIPLKPAAATPASSPSSPAVPKVTHREREEYKRFLRRRPKLKAELERNPNLIYDKDFLLKNQDFSDFLDAHPNFRKGVQPGTESSSSTVNEREQRRRERIKRREKQLSNMTKSHHEQPPPASPASASEPAPVPTH
ncbi:MAG TPA: hypothetical protein VMU16_06100 [Candidatus Binataceae bacterium]|nr:hypothetical protein [Candidatus Binataceae bacterium]